MIIKGPKQSVVAFDQLEWLAKDEPSPKKEVRSFLRGLYEEIFGKKVKSVKGEDEKDEVEDDDDSDLRSGLLDVVYEHFSLTEGGDVLLEADDGDPWRRKRRGCSGMVVEVVADRHECRRLERGRAWSWQSNRKKVIVYLVHSTG